MRRIWRRFLFPLSFPQCPYRTSLYSLLYVSSVVSSHKYHETEKVISFVCRRDDSSACDSLPLPHVQTRNTKSLTLIESERVQQMSTNLAAEALNPWLFSVSSNSRVQSIVLQFCGLTDDIKGDASIAAKYSNQNALIIPSQLSAARREKLNCDKPVSGKELKSQNRTPVPCYINLPNFDSLELTTATQYIYVPDPPVGGRPVVSLNRAAFSVTLYSPSVL